MVLLHYSLLDQKYPLGKFGPNKQNYLIKIKFAT